MQTVIIGSGNVAHVLGHKLVAAGHVVQQVLGRDGPKAHLLATRLGAVPVTGFNYLEKNADLYLIAVSDGAIATVAAALPKVNGLVVHTAGSVAMQVLQDVADNYGVLYPLQSLRKEKTDYAEIPLLVNGNTPQTTNTLQTLARSMSQMVLQADDAYRLKLHLAAVVVSNFTNHLYALAAAFCQAEKTDFHLLQPLIAETAERIQQYSPSRMQTGPAVRGDEATIYRHLHLLDGHPHLQQVYRHLTTSIQSVNGEW